jgi:hypothetical protein
VRPVTDLQRSVAPFEVDHGHGAVRRPAEGDRRDRARIPAGDRTPCCSARPVPARPRPSPGCRAAAAAGARDAAQQDPGRPVRQRAARDAAEQRGRVLRLVLRLLPARGVRPADRHLHREGLLDQRRGGAAAALGDQLAAHQAGYHRGRLGVLHLRPGHAAGVRGPDGQGARSATPSSGTRCSASWWACSTPATTWPSPAARSGCAATPSRSSRSTRSSPSGSRCSATRSSG